MLAATVAISNAKDIQPTKICKLSIPVLSPKERPKRKNATGNHAFGHLMADFRLRLWPSRRRAHAQ